LTAFRHFPLLWKILPFLGLIGQVGEYTSAYCAGGLPQADQKEQK